MGGKRFRVGSIAVLFAAVTLCMAIFSTLTVVTASSDLRNAQRYGEYVEKLYACESLGEQWLSEVDAHLAAGAPLPEDAWEEDELICTLIEHEGIELDIALRPENGGYTVVRWTCSTVWEPNDDWNLWL